MKPALQVALGHALVMTPQLRQAIRLLQMSTSELDIEISNAAQTNPLLEWEDGSPPSPLESLPAPASQPTDPTIDKAPDWDLPAFQDAEWSPRAGSHGNYGTESLIDTLMSEETLKDHLIWQLRLTPLSRRDQQIGLVIIDALDDKGYLREPLSALRDSLSDPLATEAEVLTMLYRIQRFDPVGVAARSVSECFARQLESIPESTSGRAVSLAIIAQESLLQSLPRVGVSGVAQQLNLPPERVEQAITLLRRLCPYPGRSIGGHSREEFVIPDCFIWRKEGKWHTTLTKNTGSKLKINQGYEQLIQQCNAGDASYLRGQLQEARWLLKGLEARNQTLFRVVRALIHHQTPFLEQGPQALRPLTIRELARELDLHESTVSRAIAHKYARTPHGTLALRAFFASKIASEQGSVASSVAIQTMIRRWILAENPRKPLSDAKLAERLNAEGIAIARRTVAKYREAMQLPASHERLRIS